MAGSLEGKVALVTGGGLGLGRATALAFVRAGARVVVADVDAEGGAETVRRVKAAGGEALFVRTDVSRAAEVEAMVDNTVASYGRLDCAFNNAGVSSPQAGGGGPIHEHPEETWDRVISINLKGAWLCLKYEIGQMLQQGGGAIVNAASIYGLVGSNRGSSAYTASKHGVVGLTKAAALENAQRGIRVNAVCPGFIHTRMTEQIFAQQPEREQEALAAHPMGRIGQPNEIAETVVWLCSDAASFVTGHALPVDGGYVAQ
ncbi:MAG: short chain dehydrogenase [Dehalococcoidia bacterium]|nr:short chain dehydrogenase [Dehalococcoidia bacterium]